MGHRITKVEYNQEDFSRFQNKLFAQLEQLEDIIKGPNFGHEPMKIGAEREMYLIDKDAEVSLSNQSLIEASKDDHFQPELNRYNLELNLDPVNLAGSPFSALRAQMQEKTDFLEQVAAEQGISIIPIGILPTLRQEHMHASHMTDIPRYHCLAKYLYQARGTDFKVNINGEEPLSMDFQNICAEGANTSFQVHLMVPPERFTKVYNAAQLTLPLVTAIGANSGIFLGQRLWDETRIALFKQSIDVRQPNATPWQEQPRVNFGFGWLNGSPVDLFGQSVSMFSPLIPATFDETDESGLPALRELCVHLGTTWPWHRPVYCNAGNGHIRLEFRAIPAGPTSLDMLATTAFAIGLATGMANNVDMYTSVLPFQYAEYNFYRAAQSGLGAKIRWPLRHRYCVEEVDIKTLIEEFLPVADQGLRQLSISEQDARFYLGIIEDRLTTGVTGAVWQKETLRHLERSMSKTEACTALTHLYLKECRTCAPVSQWRRAWQ